MKYGLCYNCHKHAGKPYFCSVKCAAEYGNIIFAAGAGWEGPQYCSTCKDWLFGDIQFEACESKNHKIIKITRPEETK